MADNYILDIQIRANLDSFKSQLKEMQGIVKNSNFGKSIAGDVDSINNSFRNLTRTIAPFMTGLMAIRGVIKSIKESSRQEEISNLFGQAFGQDADKVAGQLNAVSNALKLNKADTLNAASGFQLLVGNMVGYGQQSEDMAKALTVRSADMGSFFNMNTAQVANNIKSALGGASMAVRKYGIDTTTAGMQQWALAHGVNTAVKNMSQAEKIMIRYNIIMEQSSVASGDLKRTMGSTANVIRAMGNAVKDMAAAFGRIFTPILKALSAPLMGLITMLTGVFNTIGNFMSVLTGIQPSAGSGAGAYLTEMADNGDDLASSLDDVDVGMGDIGDSADDSNKKAKELKNTLRGFDEINLLNLDKGSGGSGSANGNGKDKGNGAGGNGAGSGANAVLQVNNNIGTTTKAVSPLAEAIRNLFSEFDKFGNLTKIFSDLWEIIKNVTKDIGGQLHDALINTLKYLDPNSNHWTASMVRSIADLGLEAQKFFKYLDEAVRIFLHSGGQDMLNNIGDIIAILVKLGSDILAGVMQGFRNAFNPLVIKILAGSLYLITEGIKMILAPLGILKPIWGAIFTMAFNLIIVRIGTSIYAMAVNFAKSATSIGETNRVVKVLNQMFGGFIEPIVAVVRWIATFAKSLFGLAKAEETAAAGQKALNLAMSANGIIAIITIIVSLVEWLGNLFGWFGKNKDAVKQFNDEADKATNLKSIYDDAAKSVKSATDQLSDHFNMLSGKGQDALNKLNETNETTWGAVKTVSADSVGELKALYDSLNEQEKASFFAKYGYIKGVNDQWQVDSANTNDQIIANNKAAIDQILADTKMEYTEKERLINEHKQKIVDASISEIQNNIDKINKLKTDNSIDSEAKEAMLDSLRESNKSHMKDILDNSSMTYGELASRFGTATGNMQGNANVATTNINNNLSAISPSFHNLENGYNDTLNNMGSNAKGMAGYISGIFSSIKFNANGGVGDIPYGPPIPRHASGGIFDRPHIGWVGEAGGEAVIPATRNSAVLDQLSDRLLSKLGGGSQVIALNVDGQELARTVATGINRITATTGNIPLMI